MNDGGWVRAPLDGKRLVGGARVFKARMDMPAKKRQELVGALGRPVADTCDLYGQAKQAHWSVKGPRFDQIYTALFDSLAGEVPGYIDLIAERSTGLGGTALGAVRMSAAASGLTEYPLHAVGSMRRLEVLAQRLAALAAPTRAAIGAVEQLGEADTVDLLTKISRGLDKG
jgi:starvation-inducible DNA-binding protein